MLPDSKNEFPKCLYLDLNKWIDLARAHYGKPGGDPFRPALQAVQKAIRAGTIVVPFSLINGVEAEAHSDAQRRRRLARFLVELSNNLIVLPHHIIQTWEIENALRHHFTNWRPIHIRASIVRPGYARALGKEVRVGGVLPEVAAQAVEFAYSPEMSVELLDMMGDERRLTEQSRLGDSEAAAPGERVRAFASANLTTEQRRGAELAEVFTEGESGKALVDGMRKLGITRQTFIARLSTPAAFNGFVRQIPTLDVFLDLLLARDQDRVRRIPNNDIKDLLSLSVAVPYANIVVSEHYWAHMIKARRLDNSARALPFGMGKPVSASVVRYLGMVGLLRSKKNLTSAEAFSQRFRFS